MENSYLVFHKALVYKPSHQLEKLIVKPANGFKIFFKFYLKRFIYSHSTKGKYSAKFLSTQVPWFPSLEVTSVPGVLYNFTENIMYMLK